MDVLASEASQVINQLRKTIFAPTSITTRKVAVMRKMILKEGVPPPLRGVRTNEMLELSVDILSNQLETTSRGWQAQHKYRKP